MTCARVVWLAVAVAACSPSRPVDAPAGPRVEVTVDLPAMPLLFDVPAPVTLRVENRTAGPVAVVGLVAEVAGHPFFDELLISHLISAPQGSLERVVGTLSVEALGPRARAPESPRWDWQGRLRLVTFPVLLPGESLHRLATWVPSGRTQPLVARARFVRLDPANALVVGAREIQRVEEGAEGLGWRPVARLTASFGPAVALPSDGFEPLSWDGAPMAVAPPEIYPVGMTSAVFARLEQEEARGMRAPSMQAPKVSLFRARLLAEVPEGPSAYFAAAGAWALEADDKTFLVDAGTVRFCPGRATALVRALNASEPVVVSLFEDASEPDPGGLLAGLANLGLAAQSAQRKGGGFSASLAVRRGDFVAFCEVLVDRGLRLQGTRLAPGR